jgi:cytochrome c peroxidase
MRKQSIIIFALFSTIILFSFFIESCKKSDVVAGITPLRFTTPPGFPQTQYDFAANPLTKEGFELGRKLFYEGKLSKDGNFPCASCHQQAGSFATVDHDLSHGFDNQFTTRNAPPLFNLAWHKEFHWDGGINHLDVQPLAPITAPNEMAEDMNNVVKKLKEDVAYPSLFKKAFGTDEINSQRIFRSLSQFMVMMVSANAKYDKMKRGEVTFTQNEQTGYNLFKAKCASCHAEPLFTDLSYRNNGLALNASLKDAGRMRITNNRMDSLKFKVPSLRNVTLSAPYMHDGRFFDLFTVLTHYATGINNSTTLDPLLANKIPLTLLEKDYLIIFLQTLTDSSFLTDKQFEQPR